MVRPHGAIGNKVPIALMNPGGRNQPAPLTQAGKRQPPLVQRLGADHIDVISPELLFSKLSEINVDDIIAEFSKVR